MRVRFPSLILLAPLALILSTSHARADSITYGASSTTGPLSGTANFTTSSGVLTVTLTNTTAISTLRSSGQALSDITFTLTNAPGTLGGTAVSGHLGNVSTSGVVTYTTGTPVRFLGLGPAPPNGTGTFTSSGDTITMEALGGGQPSEMILPSIANGGTYSDVNNGVAKFDPYTIGPATFTLDLSGVTSATTVSYAQFSFGTGPDTFLTGTPLSTPPAVPEPPSLPLTLTGLLVGAGLVVKRQLAG